MTAVEFREVQGEFSLLWGKLAVQHVGAPGSPWGRNVSLQGQPWMPQTKLPNAWIEKHPRKFKVSKIQSVQYLLCETLPFILLDVGLIRIISQGHLGNLAEICMAGAHTMMGQVLSCPKAAPCLLTHVDKPTVGTCPWEPECHFGAHKERVKSCKMSSSINFASDTVGCGSQRLLLFSGCVAARDVLCHC